METECIINVVFKGATISFLSLARAKNYVSPNRIRGYIPHITGWEYLSSTDDFRCIAPINTTNCFTLQSGESSPVVFSEETDYVIKLVENILTFIRLLCKAKDNEDYLLAISVFAQCRANRSLTSLLADQWNTIMAFNLQDSEPISAFQQLKDVLSQYDSVKKLPIFTKLYRFLMYCVGTSLFEKMGVTFDLKRFTHIEEAAIKKEFHLGPDFIHCMLDTIVFFSETGYQCMVTGTLSPMFHHVSTYEKWQQEGELLRIQSRYISNPEPHGFTVFDFLSRLDDNIEKGKCIIKFAGKGDSSILIMRRLLSDLEMIRADCKTKRLAQQERKAPFAVLVHGGSSVAKSQFTKMLFYHYGKLFNLPIGDEYKYTRNAFDQYWTNFNTSQWCLQLDDIAYLHPNSAQGCDPSLLEMLQVINNVPYVPTQADLADKGKTPVRSRFVIATSNTETLNAETYFACPLAVQRRLPYVISLEPKKEYRRDDGPMIDPTKIPPSTPGTYPNLWRITIKKVKSNSKPKLHMGQTAELEIIHIFEHIADFIEWFNCVALSSEGTQEQAMKCDEDMRSTVLCKHFMPSDCIKCFMEEQPNFSRALPPVLQSGDDAEYINLPPDDGAIIRTRWTDTVSERFADWCYERCPTFGDRTMTSLLQSISGMDILTRVIVMWYCCVLYVANKWWWGNILVSYLFGRWYFFVVACKFMHIPEMRHLCVRLIGQRAFRATRSTHVIKLCASILAAVSLIKASSYLINSSGFFKKAEKPKLYMCYSQICGDCTVCDMRDTHYVECDGCVACDRWNAASWNNAREVHKLKCPGFQCRRCIQLQGAAAERGQSPPPKGDKKENVWYKDHFECTTYDVTPSILSKASWSIEDLSKYIAPNCIFYTVRARTENTICEKYGRAICVGGHTYLFNNHCVPYDSFELSVVFQSGKEGVSSNFTTLVTPAQLTRYPEKDILLINLSSIPPKKDIRELFAKESFEGRFDGQYISRSSNGSMCDNVIRIPKLDKTFTFENVDRNVYISTPVWIGRSDNFTVDGDCGSLFVSKTPMGPMILGIHVLGGLNREVISIAVSNEFLNSISTPIFSDSKPILQVGDYCQDLVDLSKKATVRYIESGTMIVYGSLSGFRGDMKSRVAKTLMSDIAVRDGFKRETGPPLMNSYLPWRNAMLDMVRPVSHIDLTLLQHCVEEFSRDILSKLSENDLSEIQVYDLNTAVNGRPGLAYVDKMPRHTSAGFPFRKSKKYFLEAVEPFDDYQHPVKVTPEIEKEMDYIIVQYENSRVYCPVFTASLKDDPTAFKKIIAGKTRVFCGAPLPWSLVVRMYTLSFIRLIQRNRFLFESGPGTIAQSLEWDGLYKHITQFGENRIVAGDYGKFDKRMPASVILAAFKILENIALAAGWNKTQVRVLQGIAEDVAFPTIDFHGELIRCYGSNPSGHPLTVIINGLANCLYVRYCYTTNHPQRTCSDFKENIALMTYGDDMIMGVNPLCTWIDHTKMQKVLSDIDIEFTMAEKTAKSVPFIHISEATFLRRSWRYEEAVSAYVCPIEHASIDKMLTMCVRSKTIGPELHAICVFETACREYFWYGKQIFDEKRSLFINWIHELNIDCYVERDLPSWNQLLEEFKLNSSLRD